MPTAPTHEGLSTDSPGDDLPALVAVSDTTLRSAVEEALSFARLRPVSSGSVPDAPLPVLAVVDTATVEAAGPDLRSWLLPGADGSGPPVILITTGELLDVEDMVRRGITDFVLSPLAGNELSYRAALIRAESLAVRRRREVNNLLRGKARVISAAVRATNDPHVMADAVVSGLGGVFGADHVALTTFPDERVPELLTSWSRPGTRAAIPAPDPGQAIEVAEMLWENGRVLAARDHWDPECDTHPILHPAPREAGLRTSVIVPLGHGDRPFGIIWLAGENTERIWTPTELSLIQHVSGNLAHGLVQGHLITAQRTVLARQRELDREKTDFVATINHELRTPLTSITGYLDLILDGSGGGISPEIAQMLEIVGRNASRLNHLIGDLLTISRSDAEEPRMDVEELILSELLDQVIASLTPAAASRNIGLTLQETDSAFRLDGDREQLERVFSNLVSNAVKFTPPGGSVNVEACRVPVTDGKAPMLRICVRDTGIGIPAEDLPRLFGRFFRASNATAAAIPGTGLGLAIVQDIVHQHGGTLTIDSAVGEGTCVEVLLPSG
ncbi:ATP-binding protein [Arthrobacter caoxuetaonis]|uniref:histidine kinase n=1 Tax=Arthrobacter caoxuetaonis TaxID=2886935 RepID=A0A9X1SGP4_9MICC|nr:ATP-binding protein [Arthrobacter caoxuetaonis]MCC3299579.1 GAF domain-containing sensor histidine kinase [Arthrobacter caoxuetaonis]USQ57825.1 GAF domain-containing sensor histidine kinase [Arthrobacter caoxuetaonis]